MSFNNQTPEALLGRSDSRNPATTCHGLTTAGKPCRRSLAAKKTVSARSQSLQPGVVAVVEGAQGQLLDAAFYCWQHKDQAVTDAPKPNKHSQSRISRLVTVNERTSMDSLVERLGISGIDGPSPDLRHGQSPATQVPHDNRDVSSSYRRDTHRQPVVGPTGLPVSQGHTTTKKKKHKGGFLSQLCCFSSSSNDDDYYEIVRHRRKPPTQRHLSFIPPTLKPDTTAILLTELAKPISPHDDEGYIYIFWLTDTDKVPDTDTASSLLSHSASRGRDLDSLARTYSKRASKAATNRTIMLKIGRANNVHRRMTEWTQQCGYALSLVRWYPYISSSPQPSPRREVPPSHLHPRGPRPSLATRGSSDQVRKVPHVHRVERLIHLELADKRVKRNCEACGKEHREWFEIEATEQGVKAVDDVVRRWTAWAEQRDAKH
ncbi:meiotically up-regulated gene 113-domain-containing protein [Elsinoe ampelina]|uniref:Meiotically up-regulated gene 113-domain-containing protein n=1 Tax=Elsinoe ampelina TaxID=302913 RepID=A0A6A6GQX9_9PEZI|nr:meiotically up-regulated gene 113-domain-containing protein [Elsinoe ampelina]